MGFVFLQLFSLGSFNGASVCTSTAFDASISVDNVLAVAFRNSLNGAFCCASAA